MSEIGTLPSYLNDLFVQKRTLENRKTFRMHVDLAVCVPLASMPNSTCDDVDDDMDDDLYKHLSTYTHKYIHAHIYTYILTQIHT